MFYLVTLPAMFRLLRAGGSEGTGPVGFTYLTDMVEKAQKKRKKRKKEKEKRIYLKGKERKILKAYTPVPRI